MRRTSNKFVTTFVLLVLVMVSLLNGAGSFFGAKVSAAYLGARSLELSDSKAGASGVTYNVKFATSTAGSIGSVQIEFCSNSTFITDSCTAPVGLDASAATIASQSGLTGFTISNASTANNLILTRTAAVAGLVTANFTLKNITNPSSNGSYYGRFVTYQTVDASGPPTDHGGVAFAINPAVSVNLTVPPYLLFCVGVAITGTDCSTASGDFIDMGDFSTSATSSGQSQMVVATNGKSGYGITVSGTTMLSGTNSIPAMQVSAPSTVGVSQFGINLRANTKPAVGSNPSGPGQGSPEFNYNQPNQYHYNDGDVIAAATSPEDLRKYTVSYIVNVGSTQPVGIYSSTYTYIALANF